MKSGKVDKENIDQVTNVLAEFIEGSRKPSKEANDIKTYSELLAGLVKKGEKLSENCTHQNPEIVIAAMRAGHLDLAVNLAAAGANTEIGIGQKSLYNSIYTSLIIKEGNAKHDDLKSITNFQEKTFEKIDAAYKDTSIEDVDNDLTVEKVDGIVKWNPLAEIAATMVKAKPAEKEKLFAAARDFVANGVAIEAVDMIVKTKNSANQEDYKVIHKNVLDILKDNIKGDAVQQKAAKQDFDQMKDALREAQDLLKQKIIADRLARREKGERALLGDAIHMFKKAVGITVKETERDKLRNKQKEIGEKLRESGSMSSSVMNVLSMNISSKKERSH